MTFKKKGKWLAPISGFLTGAGVSYIELKLYFPSLILLTFGVVVTIEWVRGLIQAKNKPFTPNWVSPPGNTIAESYFYFGWTFEEFAYKMGMSYMEAKLLINGDLELTHDIAIKLQDLFKVDVSFWINRERDYRDGLARGLKVIK